MICRNEYDYCMNLELFKDLNIGKIAFRTDTGFIVEIKKSNVAIGTTDPLYDFVIDDVTILRERRLKTDNVHQQINLAISSHIANLTIEKLDKELNVQLVSKVNDTTVQMMPKNDTKINLLTIRNGNEVTIEGVNVLIKVTGKQLAEGLKYLSANVKLRIGMK